MKLLLAPHNDDEVLFASYTLLRESPHVIVCLRSQGNHERREIETDRAMEILGCEWEQLPMLAGQPNMDPAWEELEVHFQRWIVRLINSDDDEHQIWAPAWEALGHEEHNVVSDIAVRIFGAENVTHYTTYQRGKGHTIGKTLVPHKQWYIPLKLRALACYESQISDPLTQSWFYELLDMREFYA